MDATNQVTTATTVMGRWYSHLSGHDSSSGMHLVLIIVLALLVHLAVKVIRHLSEWIIHQGQAQKRALGFVTQQPKFVTLIKLIANGVVFLIYFFAVGLALEELGVNLKGYLASASIVALAISFGSQGLVQDVVIGLTLITSDAMDVGDLVEIFASTTVIGRVEEIGMRFTIVRNFFNQLVFIPNRTIANVSRFPQGGVFAYADIQMPQNADPAKAVAVIQAAVQGMWGQFGAIILTEQQSGEEETAPGGVWNFVRDHFKIWPGQGVLIETTFRQQIVSAMKALQPDYADWQVPVTYRNVTAAGKA